MRARLKLTGAAAAGMMALSLAAFCGAGAARGEVSLRYDFYAGGFRVGTVEADAELSEASYRANAVFRTEGWLEDLFDIDFAFAASGVSTDGNWTPSSFRSVYGGFEGNPVVLVDFGEGKVPVSATPAPPEGVMPDDVAERQHFIDPITAVLGEMARRDGAPCGRRLHLFDGIRTYTLVLEDAETDILEPTNEGSYAGASLRCAWHYELGRTGQGDWARDLFAETPPTGTIWFAHDPESGMTVPVKFLAETPVVSVVVHLMQADANGRAMTLGMAPAPADEGSSLE
ncbi:MAG: DUF3108 domain-containing protein [Alphaproteobacteria bacterium]|nr:DUF3108 domain-containing protein [Alphaproteobacteria bacterium]